MDFFKRCKKLFQSSCEYKVKLNTMKGIMDKVDELISFLIILLLSSKTRQYKKNPTHQVLFGCCPKTTTTIHK